MHRRGHVGDPAVRVLQLCAQLRHFLVGLVQVSVYARGECLVVVHHVSKLGLGVHQEPAHERHRGLQGRLLLLMSAACVAAAPARLLLLRRPLAASRSALAPRLLSSLLLSLLLPVLSRCGPLLLVMMLLLLLLMLPLEPCRCRDAVLLGLPVWRAEDVAHDLLVQRVQGLDGRCG